MVWLNYQQRGDIYALLREYHDIFKDEIDHKKHIGEECGIVFKKNVKIVPSKCKTARAPPKAFQDVCKEKVESLLSGNLMVEDDSPSEWLARGHFVPKKSKNGEKRARLVINYIDVNSVIERGIRGFPTMNELRAAATHQNGWPNTCYICLFVLGPMEVSLLQ